MKCFVLAAAFLSVASPALAQQTLRTSDFSGDLGAQINAADQKLGPGAGVIVVDRAAEATTPVQLSQGHGLRLNAAATFATTITLAGNNAIECRPGAGKFILNLPQPTGHGNFMSATSTQKITVQHCSISALNAGGDYMFLHAHGVDGVRIVDCHSDDVPLVFVDSADRDYANLSAAKQSHNIVVDHNTVVLSSPGYMRHQATGVMIYFAANSKVTHNEFRGGAHGVQYWGNDNIHNKASGEILRWVTDLEISDNDCHDVRGSCFWGTMGERVQFLRNHAENCGDACLDVEWSKDVVLADNDSTDGGNGAIALLSRQANIRILNNRMTATTAKYPLFSLFNNAVAAEKASDVTLEGNVMVCRDTQTPCLIKYENTQNFSFVHNEVTNGIMKPVTLWQQGTKIQNNTFTYTLSASEPFYAIDGGGQIAGAYTDIQNNTILSNARQPDGSECIHITSVAPHQKPPGNYVVEGNTCGGSDPFPVALSMTNVGPVGSPTFMVRGNHFSGAIQHADQTGRARFSIQQ